MAAPPRSPRIYGGRGKGPHPLSSRERSPAAAAAPSAAASTGMGSRGIYSGKSRQHKAVPAYTSQPHGPEQLKASQKTQQRAEPFQYPGHLPGLKSPQQYQCEQGARADAHRQFRSMCIPPLHTGPPFTDFLPEGKRLRTPLHPKWSPRRSAREWDDQTPPGYGGP